MCQQPFDRAQTGKRKAILHFLLLFGGVDVDRAVRVHRHQCGKLLARHRAQAVGSDAEAVAVSQQRTAGLEHCGKAVEAMDEAALAAVWGLSAEIAVSVKHRQQGQSDPGCVGGMGDAGGHFCRIAVASSLRVVVEVVELAHMGIAALEHLGIGHRGDGFDVIRREPIEEAVHHLAPAPEIVVARARAAAMLSQPRHAALKGVAMDIGEAGDGDGVVLIGGVSGRTRLNRSDPAILDRNPHIARPASWQQGGGKPESRHHVSSCGAIICLDIINPICNSYDHAPRLLHCL